MRKHLAIACVATLIYVSASLAGALPVSSIPSAAQIGHGHALFNTYCSACHQSNGQGLPGLFPPLKGNRAVNKPDPGHHIETVLFGEHGARVGGVCYASPMPRFGSALSDQDVVDLVDFERSAWGNHGAPVSRDEVASIRASANAPHFHTSSRQ